MTYRGKSRRVQREQGWGSALSHFWQLPPPRGYAAFSNLGPPSCSARAALEPRRGASRFFHRQRRGGAASCYGEQVRHVEGFLVGSSGGRRIAFSRWSGSSSRGRGERPGRPCFHGAVLGVPRRVWRSLCHLYMGPLFCVLRLSGHAFEQRARLHCNHNLAVRLHGAAASTALLHMGFGDFPRRPSAACFRRWKTPLESLCGGNAFIQARLHRERSGAGTLFRLRPLSGPRSLCVHDGRRGERGGNPSWPVPVLFATYAAVGLLLTLLRTKLASLPDRQIVFLLQDLGLPAMAIIALAVKMIPLDAVAYGMFVEFMELFFHIIVLLAWVSVASCSYFGFARQPYSCAATAIAFDLFLVMGYLIGGKTSLFRAVVFGGLTALFLLYAVATAGRNLVFSTKALKLPTSWLNQRFPTWMRCPLRSPRSTGCRLARQKCSRNSPTGTRPATSLKFLSCRATPSAPI